MKCLLFLVSELSSHGLLLIGKYGKNGVVTGKLNLCVCVCVCVCVFVGVSWVRVVNILFGIS